MVAPVAFEASPGQSVRQGFCLGRASHRRVCCVSSSGCMSCDDVCEIHDLCISNMCWCISNMMAVMMAVFPTCVGACFCLDRASHRRVCIVCIYMHRNVTEIIGATERHVYAHVYICTCVYARCMYKAARCMYMDVVMLWTSEDNTGIM